MAQDWVFLAVAHYRLGQAAEARRWLAKTRAVQQQDFWDQQEVELLLREAETLINGDQKSKSANGTRKQAEAQFDNK